MNRREERVRRVLISLLYLGAIYKLGTLPHTHKILDAIVQGRDGFKPYLVLVGIAMVFGLVHKGINWVFLKGSR